MNGVNASKGKFISWCHADLQTKPQDVVNAFLINKNQLNNLKTAVITKELIEIILIKFLQLVCLY